LSFCIAHSKGHEPRTPMLQGIAGQLAFGRLDGVVQLPTLRYAANSLGLNPATTEFVYNLANAGLVDSNGDFVWEKSYIFESLDNVRYLQDVVSNTLCNS